MRPDDPRHGERRGFLQHRRDGEDPCEPCKVASRRACKAYNVARRRGEPSRRLPISELVDVFDEGRANGIAPSTLCSAAGLSSSHIASVHKRKHVNASTITRLRAALVREVESGEVPVDLTRMRIRSLQRQGYTTRHIGELVGQDVETGRWRSAERVNVRMAAAIRDLCRQVGDTYGPSTRSAALGKGRGWPPLAGWDDPGTLAWPGGEAWEGPRPEPVRTDVDHAVVWRVLDGDVLPTTRDERFEIMRKHLERGGSEHELTERLGWKDGRYTPAAREREVA